MWKHNLHQSGEKGENLSLQDTIRATILEVCNLYKLEIEPKNPIQLHGIPAFLPY